LFYLDSRGSFFDAVISFWRACKMILYGLPFLLVLVLIVYLIYFLLPLPYFLTLYLLVKFLPFMISVKTILLLASLMKHVFILSSVPVIAMVANFYTKRLHDQFTLYFRS